MTSPLATLVVDNLSPFTPDILACLDKLGTTYVYRKYSEVTQDDLTTKCKRVILSGRRRNDQAINAANSQIVRHCHDNDVPLLGICYGAEIIALTLGGSIRRMPSHLHGQIEITATSPNPLVPAEKDSRISVYESHGFCIARLPEGFVRLAGSKYCEYEIFAHKTKKIYGTQFHPEKSGPDGLDLLEKFTRI
ncbi:GMP synthase family protein [Candidatus Nitrososphaera evergladensis SR1]|jgi:GMP synthase (glutamine-hydrolysing)|uniref:GMP synthase family protein n=1 Tax=Candidatus Nitrososphaera evergladensis SR1 TaxID=1459636 RepID=A0A075MSD3_9ARCH|nr:gamma-glutamyl-gamma-aminobutyrate hydrolase family protein [Candidatus Nitrososphaera evergladensis]AIF84025.1 GMP synthase family protein [Candidatus Nitrososphaera evergladensis SR1]